MSILCNLQVDVQVQDNGKLDVYINNEGNSGYHYTNIIPEDVGRLVAEEIEMRIE